MEDAKEVIRIPREDPDDIFFSTDENIFREMAAVGYNSILQDNENARKDGSLSVYFGERRRAYVNIETEHGKLKQYKEMLEALLKILKNP